MSYKTELLNNIRKDLKNALENSINVVDILNSLKEDVGIQRKGANDYVVLRSVEYSTNALCDALEVEEWAPAEFACGECIKVDFYLYVESEYSLVINVEFNEGYLDENFFKEYDNIVEYTNEFGVDKVVDELMKYLYNTLEDIGCNHRCTYELDRECDIF